MPKPLVAIIGRPNVGKSTLFNRIIGTRKALTHDQPGVTRDRNFATAEWGGREFICVDTGGFPLEAESLDEGVEKQIELAIEESDVILCIFDGAAGPNPVEAQLVERLRRVQKPVLYAVNKIDVPEHESRLNDFFRLGIEDLMPVSGEHGYQVAELLDRLLQVLPAEIKPQAAEDRMIHIAVVGRPNVGKSSLVNALLGQSRVVVDATPGTTRDSIDTPFHLDDRDYVLIDTAGIRRRSQKGGHLERITVMHSLRAIDRADVCLLVLAADEGLSKQDAHIAGYIAERGRALMVVWNKLDLISKEQFREREQEVRERCPFLHQVPVVGVSALAARGLGLVLPGIDSLYEEWGTQVATGRLNAVFASLVEHHHLPMYKGKTVKLFYATQAQTRPPTFMVFANYPEGVAPSYRRYLIRGLQEQLHLEHVPIRLVLRRRA